MLDINTAEYEALTESAGFVNLTGQTLVSIDGKDRHSFLHSFCTADVKGLQTGRLTEAFVLNEKGKILSHVFCLAMDKEILLYGTGQQADVLIQHLDKYIIRENVQLVNQSDEWEAYWVCGAETAVALGSMFASLPQQNQSVVVSANDSTIIVANAEIAGEGFLLLTPTSNSAYLASDLVNAGITRCSEESLHLVRIENRTPWFGQDMDVSNLPQELNRDEQAISFEKGCYLGQETVARIDAIGHVNQLLVKLQFTGKRIPVAGTELISEEKVVGRVTSVAKSLTDDQAVGLGFVRRAKAKEGVELAFPDGTATVI